MFTVQRPLIAQQFDTFGFTVTTTAQSPTPQLQLNSLVDVFIITVPAAAANSIFLGSTPGVTTATGLEIVAGTSVQFRIDHGGRQLYELQKPSIDIEAAVRCMNIGPEAIPFVCWDMSQVFLVAVAATNISLATFRALYI